VALIADNRRDELKMTLGSYSFDISHLCHNRKCFNPEHLVVESRRTNNRRQSCNGRKILVAGDDFSYHPCAHGSVEKMRKCILPEHHVGDNIVSNNDVQPSTEATPVPDPDDTASVNNGGYCRLQLRRGAEILMHHLALIADNRAAELK
ncbi:zinc-binding loop region of homing endonuclease-domain-containing protein, partial [Lipomyces tetrasporus]